jgi:hypothetical protein
MNTYEIIIVGDHQAIRCLRCGLTSHNVHDVEELYCGFCDVFHTESEEPHGSIHSR